MAGVDRPRTRESYAESRTAVQEMPTRRPVVLVIEDDPDDWQIYGKILWYNGYDVLYAGDGIAGYELANAHLPDLILLDLMIPGLDGIALCRRLKSEAATSSIPVIVLSGRTFAEAGLAATSAGCAAYLEKPAGPVDVLHRVEELIGRAPPPGEGRAPEMYPPTA